MNIPNTAAGPMVQPPSYEDFHTNMDLLWVNYRAKMDQLEAIREARLCGSAYLFAIREIIDADYGAKMDLLYVTFYAG